MWDYTHVLCQVPTTKSFGILESLRYMSLLYLFRVFNNLFKATERMPANLTPCHLYLFKLSQVPHRETYSTLALLTSFSFILA